MENKLLITQALDERDLLVKKINSKIERIDFVDGKKRNEEKVIQQVITKEEFCKKVKTSYQQIQDLIKRYQKIDEAIITSNANTYIETSFGTYSVAVALSMRNRLRELNAMDFETILRNKMEENYYEVLELKDLRNRCGLADALFGAGRGAHFARQAYFAGAADPLGHGTVVVGRDHRRHDREVQPRVRDLVGL